MDKTSLRWVKIQESGINYSTQVWANQALINQGNKWSVTIPSSLKAGNYVIRHEILAYVTPSHQLSPKVNSIDLTYLVHMVPRVRMACKTTRSALILPSLGRALSRFLLELQQPRSINPLIQASCSTLTLQLRTTLSLAQLCGRARFGECSVSFCSEVFITQSSLRKYKLRNYLKYIQCWKFIYVEAADNPIYLVYFNYIVSG